MFEKFSKVPAVFQPLVEPVGRSLSRLANKLNIIRYSQMPENELGQKVLEGVTVGVKIVGGITSIIVLRKMGAMFVDFIER